ncbi:MAG: flagellar hook-associated protein FlgL [Woeseiaceae bacterium]|nr:flagellar hook-associated protein FlgL [Woeseiaceae bacterium]
MSQRISTLSSLNSSISLMQRLQSSIDLTGRQIASGRRILTPADDPISSARAIELRESLARTQQFDRNSAVVTSRLSQEETALAATNDILQRIRELALQANNATVGNEARGQIGVEVRAQLKQLINLANQKDGNGAYMFAGTRENVQPVIQNGSSFSYNGDDGRRLIQIGEGRTVPDGDPGAEIFFRIRNGNGTFAASPAAGNTGTGVVGNGSVFDPSQYDRDTYTVTFTAADTYEVRDSSAALVATSTFAPGDTIAFRGIEFTLNGAPNVGDAFDVEPSRFRDVFSMVSDLADAIETAVFDDISQASLNNGINRGLEDLDQAIGSVLSARTDVGSRLSIIEDQENTNSANAITFQETLARIEDLDYAEALSRLSQQTTILEAAQKSFVRTQGLSLFNFI